MDGFSALCILAFVPALREGEILWIACMNGIEQCIHGDVIFKEQTK